MIVTTYRTASDEAYEQRLLLRLKLKQREEKRQRKASFLQHGSGKSWHRSNRFSL